VIEVFRAPLDIDLSAFTKQLWALKISHRVAFEESQILLVAQPQYAANVYQLYQYWLTHGRFSEALVLEIETQQNIQQASPAGFNRSRKVNFSKIPVVITLLLVSLLMSTVVSFGENTQLLRYFTITDFQLFDDRVSYTSLMFNLESWQLWRFISPIFLHFNLSHIVFNSLWLWIVGTVIEQRHGSGALLFIVCTAGILSNIAQYLLSGPIFGGMSGVVYAIIAYAWLWDKLHHNKLRIVSNALMAFMMGWLVLGYTGILSQLGMGNIANTAHLVGLACGLLAVPCLKIWRLQR